MGRTQTSEPRDGAAAPTCFFKDPPIAAPRPPQPRTQDAPSECSTRKIHKPTSNRSCLKRPRCCGLHAACAASCQAPPPPPDVLPPGQGQPGSGPCVRPRALFPARLPALLILASRLLFLPENQITQASRSKRPRHLLSVPGSPELQPGPQGRAVQDRVSQPSSRSPSTREGRTWLPASEGQRADGFQGSVRFFSVRSSFLGSEEYVLFSFSVVRHSGPVLGTRQGANKGTWHFAVESSGGEGAGPRPRLAACVTLGSVLAARMSLWQLQGLFSHLTAIY